MTRKKTYNYLLFDWDGCLADTLSCWMKSYKKAFAQFDIFPSEEEIVNKVFGGWDNPKKLGIKNINKFNSILVPDINNKLKKAKLHKNVKKTLIQLKKIGIKIAIVTTAKRDSVLPALEKHQLKKIIDVFLGKEDVKNTKPNPEIIKKAIKLLNANKKSSLMIGDSKSDVQAGINAHIDTLIFYPAQNQKFYTLENLKKLKPNYLITNFDDLLTLVK